jgi:hypothetical protein
LPTHRLVRFPGDDERAGFARFLARHFDRRPIPCALDNVAEAARSLIDMLDEADATGRFGMYTRSEGCSLLSIRPDFLPSEPGPGGVNELGTVLIHRLLIDPALGGDGLAEGVSYGMAECALFLRPTTVEQVKRVAAAGLRMPGKSTYFYPKAPTGLVINDVSPGRAMG